MDRRTESPALMVAGTSSDVGKSFVTTGILGAARRRGLAVAPFKAINISNNARATEDGEVPTSQFVQALAAGLRPHPRFSPLLVKFGGTFVDFVVHGKSIGRHPDGAWDCVVAELQAEIDRAYDKLDSEGFDLIVVEGMGALTEPHLFHPSPANLRLSDRYGIPMVLVSEDSRGGTYASICGTWALLSQKQRKRTMGLLLNKVYDKHHETHVRLNRALLAANCPPVLGSIGCRSVSLLAEDALNVADRSRPSRTTTLQILRVPTASNLDEFDAVSHSPDIDVRWVTEDTVLDADLVVLPGCRDVPQALSWLRGTGLEKRIQDRFSRNSPILGICGGAQILTRRILNSEGQGVDVEGMGLLDAEVVFEACKIVGKKALSFSGYTGRFWHIPQQTVEVYEIHHGRIVLDAHSARTDHVDGLLFRGPVAATIYHGLLENSGMIQCLTGVFMVPSLQKDLEAIIDVFESELSMDEFFVAVNAAQLQRPRSHRGKRPTSIVTAAARR